LDEVVSGSDLLAIEVVDGFVFIFWQLLFFKNIDRTIFNLLAHFIILILSSNWLFLFNSHLSKSLQITIIFIKKLWLLLGSRFANGMRFIILKASIPIEIS